MSCIINTIINIGINNNPDYIKYDDGFFIPTSNTRTNNDAYGDAVSAKNRIETKFPVEIYGQVAFIKNRSNGIFVFVEPTKILENAYEQWEKQKRDESLKKAIDNPNYDNTRNQIVEFQEKIDSLEDELFGVNPNQSQETMSKYEELNKLKQQQLDLQLTLPENNISFNNQNLNTSPRILSDNIYSYYNLKKDVIEFKEQQLSNYKQRNYQNRQSKEYKDYINNLENEITILKEELSNININDVNEVLNFIIQDINNLKNYFNSASNQQLLQDRKLIIETIDVYNKLINGESTIDIENDNSDWRIDFSSFKNLQEIADFENIFREVKTLFKQADDKAILEMIQDTPEFTQLKEKKNMTDEEVLALVNQMQDDITFNANHFLGMNSVGDTMAMQMIKPSLGREETKLKSNVEKLKEDLKVLYEKLKNSNFDMSKFRQKDKNGIKTFDLVNQFSQEWFTDFSDFLKKGAEIWKVKYKDKVRLYRERVVFLNDNTNVIDPRRISTIVSKYSSLYPGEFNYSTAEINQYENDLKQLLGNSYDYHIRQVEEQLNRFQDYLQHQVTNNTVNAQDYILQKNPFAFLNNYYSNDVTTKVSPVGKNIKGFDIFSDISFLHIVPKQNSKNYYTSDFSDIQNNSDAFEYYLKLNEIINNVLEPTYRKEGDSLYGRNLAKFKKDLLEKLKDVFIADKELKYKAKDLWEYFLNLFKELKGYWYSNEKFTQQKGIISNYSDNTQSQINTYKKLLEQQTIKELEKKANQLGLNTSNKSIKELADMISKTEVLAQYSDDLQATTLALMDLSVIENARKNVEDKISLLRKQHGKAGKINSDGIKNERHSSNTKFDRSVNKVINNDAERSTESKFKSKAYSQFGKSTYDFISSLSPNSSLMKKVARELHRALVLFNEAEKREFDNLIKLSIDAQKTGVTFAFTSSNKDQYRYNYKLNSYTTITAGNEIKISKEEYDEALEEYIKERVKNLGVGLSAISVTLEAATKMAVPVSLGINAVSGWKNRLEAKFSLSRQDLAGTHWTTGNNDKSENILKFANTLDNKLIQSVLSKTGLIKYSDKIKTLQTIHSLLDKFDVLQDRSNELSRNKDKDSIGDVSSMLYSWSIGKPEFKIQVQILLNILQDVKVNNINNPNDFNIDFIDEKGNFTIYKPGTLELKDEYKTAENILNWENFNIGNAQNLNENQFYLTKMKTTQAIILQSNFDKNDAVGAWNHWLVKNFFVFAKFMPEQMHMRWSGGGGIDLIRGKEFEEGLYTSLMKSSPASFTSFAGTTLALNFGRVGLASSFIATGGVFGIVLGTGALAYAGFSLYQNKKAFTKSNFQTILNDTLSFKQESLISGFSNSLNYLIKVLKGTIAIPVRQFGIGNTVNIMNFGDDYLARNLTKEDIKIINATAMELSQKAFMIGMYFSISMLLKSLTGNDDDEDEKHLNFVQNHLSSFIEQMDTYTSPAAFTDERSKFMAIHYLLKIQSTFGGDENSTKGFASKSTTEKITRLSPIPSQISNWVFSDLTPLQNERNFTTTEWYYKEVKNKLTDGNYSMEKEIEKIRDEERQKLYKQDEYKKLNKEEKSKKATKAINKIYGTLKDYNSLKEYHKAVVAKNEEIEDAE